MFDLLTYKLVRTTWFYQGFYQTILKAHRLNTIIDSDRIMVLDAGKIVEFDSGRHLVRNANSTFKSMIEESKDKKQLYRALGLTKF